MRLKRVIGNSFWAAALALTMPAMQEAQAQACVKVNGLDHCELDGATVKETTNGVDVETPDTSGKGGVAIHTGAATDWTAGIFTESDEPDSTTILSSVSEGTTTSTIMVEQSGETIHYSVDFSDKSAKAGLGRGYVTVYLNDFIVAPDVPVHYLGRYPWEGQNGRPMCRPWGLTESGCRNWCHKNGYRDCDFCLRSCNWGFSSALGFSEWRFDLVYGKVHLPDGSVVVGDKIVIRSEAPTPPAPAQHFDQVHIRTTAKKLSLSNESAVNASSGK